MHHVIQQEIDFEVQVDNQLLCKNILISYYFKDYISFYDLPKTLAFAFLAKEPVI
jgi:hypothetical protein